MAGLGRKVFTAGEVLTAANVQGYLQDQTVMVFASAAARTTAVPTPSEGMMSYLSDTNVVNKYTGAAWEDIVPSLTSYVTLTGTQSVSNKTFTTSSNRQTISDISAGYSIVATDAGKLIRSTNSALTITVNNVLTAGDQIDVIQFGAGQVTFAPGSGVTLVSTDTKRKTNKQYSAATLKCLAAGVVALIGDLAA